MHEHSCTLPYESTHQTRFDPLPQGSSPSHRLRSHRPLRLVVPADLDDDPTGITRVHTSALPRARRTVCHDCSVSFRALSGLPSPAVHRREQCILGIISEGAAVY